VSAFNQHDDPFTCIHGTMFSTPNNQHAEASNEPAIKRFDARTLSGEPNGKWADSFAQDGFLVVENFATADSCAKLINAANQIADEYVAPASPTVFSTLDDQHSSQAYFLESANAVHCFLEEDAQDQDGNVTQPMRRAINKIGHALHDQVPAFDEFSRDSRLATLCAALDVRAPLLVQSMYIFKQPHIGGEVTWHQDSTFLYTDPPSVIGFWFALEAADVNNGCLWTLPGQHTAGLRNRLVRRGDAMAMEAQAGGEWDTEGGVPIEVPAGTLVVLHGALPHWSAPNRTDRSRHAYALHVVDGECTYSEENWLQRPSGQPARGFG
jgi:phytanoyl-CoA hydroxylase